MEGQKALRGTRVFFKNITLSSPHPSPHRRTKRWEAHVWLDKKQVYLGGFDQVREGGGGRGQGVWLPRALPTPFFPTRPSYPSLSPPRKCTPPKRTTSWPSRRAAPWPRWGGTVVWCGVLGDEGF